MSELMITVNERDLNSDGAFLVEAARQQSKHLALIMSPNDAGYFPVILKSSPDSDDVLRIHVKSTITFKERAKKFGLGNLGSCPSDDYLDDITRCYGEDLQRCKFWEIHGRVIGLLYGRKISHADAVNIIGSELRQWLVDGCYEIAIDNDWVSQTQAANDVGVALTTVRNAVRDGRLKIWRDMSEKNPKRQTRVRLSDVIIIWGNK